MVIGVIVATVIPTIINDIRNKDIDARLRQTYSDLSQALKRVTEKNGNVPYQCAYLDQGITLCGCTEADNCEDGCYSWVGDDNSGKWVSHAILKDSVTSECSKFLAALKQELKIVKTCTKAKEQGCTAGYKTTVEMLTEQGKYGSESGLSYKEQQKQLRSCGDEGDEYNKGPAYVLANGSVIFPLTSQKILVDVNGLKKPNRWGYDVFQFSVRMTSKSENLRLVPDGGCTLTEPGGKSTTVALKDALIK